MSETQRKTFSFDPSRDGARTDVWSVLEGTPTVSGGDYTLNEDSVISYEDFRGGTLKMKITVPTDPTPADNREFGFANNGTGDFATFKIDGTFLFSTTGNNEGSSAFRILPWSDGTVEDFTNEATVYEIRLEKANVKFIIDGVVKSQMSSASPLGPMGIYMSNANADNMVVNGVIVDGR